MNRSWTVEGTHYRPESYFDFDFSQESAQGTLDTQ